MVTTDGHRLSKAEHKVSGKTSMMNFSMLVPHKGIGELKRMLDDVKAGKGKADEPTTIGIATAGGNAFFLRDDLSLSVKLADENFPPYSKVIPSKQSRTVVAARGPLVEALRRISLVANDKSGGVQLQIEPGLLRIQSQNPEVGEGSEEVDVDYAGDELRIGFNARYLLDALSAMPHDEVAIELSGERDPGVVKPVGDDDEFIGVIMPMRI
jgi:DNA polymerase-3 subunit beta